MPADADPRQRLRRLPAIDEILRSEAGAALCAAHPRWAVVSAARAEVEALRQRILAGEAVEPVVERAALEQRARRVRQRSLRRVINATGVVLHTNLGRAPLAPRAIEQVVEVARGYSNLEYSLERGERGSRHDHLAALLGELSGAESAIVVNNNAGAVLLALAALASGREVVVSRGELVEIGGSFRIPDVMRASGAILREVGTTNKTHEEDYRRALGPETALLLKVHRSNFAVVGFTSEVEVASLATIAGAAKVPLVVDLGSGCLLDLTPHGLPPEPRVGEVLRQGADLCTFSGDKLLGGPQAGIICGRATLVDEIRRHPLMRALRPDKLTLAALEATLSLYRDGAVGDIPALAMLTVTAETLAARAAALHAAVERALAPLDPPHAAAAGRLRVEVVRTNSAVGGGALPLSEPESFAVAIALPGAALGALDHGLRAQEPPVVGRIADDHLLLDVRTIDDTDVESVARAVARAAAELRSGG
jgi:L-seryl-tRNA(Ser) seleniumtransferase